MTRYPKPRTLTTGPDDQEALFAVTETGTVVDVWDPLFDVGDLVGHRDDETWVGEVVATSRPHGDGKHHFHVRWRVGPATVHRYNAYPLYRIAHGEISRTKIARDLREWRESECRESGS